jgi:hypothetical protein
MAELFTIEDEEPLTLDTRSAGLTDDQFSRLCADNPELRMELTAKNDDGYGLETPFLPRPPAGRE